MNRVATLSAPTHLHPKNTQTHHHSTFSGQLHFPNRPLRCCSQAVRRNAAVKETSEETTETATTFYDLLGISSEGSFDEIRAAYRKMAAKYHPDVSPPERAAENTKRFIEVQEAYETLSNPGRRARYDVALSGGLCRLAAFGLASRGGGFDEELEERSNWRSSWQDQLSELKRRSMSKDSEENLSWGARMRRRRAES